MRTLLGILIATRLLVHIPVEDARNTRVPDDYTHFVMPSYSKLPEWEARKAHLRKQILSAAGLLPMPPRTPLNPKIYGTLDRGSYEIRKVLIETLPGYYLGGDVYLPTHHEGKIPGVLLAHGHWKYGRLQNETEYSVPALAVNLARQGYAVFAYDMVGYNDTRQTPHSFGGMDEELWSFSPLGLQLWNSTRALDYLASLEQVDANRLAMTGASGGSTQTFLLSAVDDRIRVSAPVNMISATMQGADPCEDAPGLRFGTFNVEIAALMAPRRMLVVSDTQDWTKNTPREEFPAIHSIYALYGRPDHVAGVQLDAPHNYNKESREAVYAFFAKHLLHRQVTPKDTEFQQERDEDLVALKDGQAPVNSLTYQGVFADWKRMAQRQFEQTTDKGALRERLQYALGSEWPTAAIVSEIVKDGVVLSRVGVGDRVTGLYLNRSAQDAALVVSPRGASAVRRSPQVQDLADSGSAVMMIDPFQSDGSRAQRSRTNRYFLTYNKSDDAIHVQDILTAMSFLRLNHSGKISLVGVDEAAVWCAFAAAVAPIEVSLVANLDNFRGADEDFKKRFFVPGIQRAGGLAAARLLTSR